jgi:hypothetical protein
VYADVVAGIVAALEPLGFENVLDYEPAAIEVAPMAYVVLATFARDKVGGVVTMRYTVTVRVAVPWTDNEQAERDLIPLVNAVPNALEVDMTLGANAAAGDRRVSQVIAGAAQYRQFANKFYRTMDVTVSVLEKGAEGSGL